MNVDKLMTPEEKKIVAASEKEAVRMLEAAKIGMLRYRPFYGTLVATMPMYCDYKWLSTIATDGRNLYFNPEFIAGMSPEREALVFKRIDESNLPDNPDPQDKTVQNKKDLKRMVKEFYRRKTTKEVIFLLEHELRHVICDHMTRGKGYNHQLYNVAADHYINVALVMEHSASGTMGKTWFNGKDSKWDDGKEWSFLEWCYMDFKYDSWTAEKIYEDLVKDRQKQRDSQNSGDEDGSGTGKPKPGSGTGGKKPADVHMGGDPDPSDSFDLDEALGIDKRAQPKISQEQADANADIMRRHIKSAAQVAGDATPQDIRELVGTFGKAKINYVQLIKKRLMSHIKHNTSYRRPSRRSYSLTRTLHDTGRMARNQTVVLPSYQKDNTIDIWIGFDVSGSVTDQLLERIFKEIMGLTRQYKQFKIHLFCWSTHVGEVTVYDQNNIRDIVNYKIETSGGTHVSCVFEYLEKNKCKCDDLIVFTDGYFEDVSERKDWAKKYDTLWVIFDNPNFKPPFGKAVDFDKYLGK